MTVRLLVQGGPYRDLGRADIGRRARAMLRALQLEDSELSVVLTGDDQIQDMNRIYRNKDRPTDVLAFAQGEGEPSLAAGLLGDVVVSVPTARRQARACGRPLLAEVTMLLAHGLLHLVGWDHETAAKDRRMRREAQRLCRAADAAVRARAGAPPGRRATRTRTQAQAKARRQDVGRNAQDRAAR